jgi:D-amino-acid dehydrogenase
MEEIGCFMMYKSAQVEKHEMELAEEAKKFNLETRIFNAQEVQAMEPDVEVNVRGGVLYPIDCHIHPGDFMRTLATYLEQAGAELQLNTTVTGFTKNGSTITSVQTDKGDFETEEVVLSTGSWLPVVSKSLGIDMLLQAGKGYSMTFENISKNLKYPAILVDKRVAMTPMGADLRMGGTMEISGLNSPQLIKRAQAIYKAALTYYPGLDVQFPEPNKIWSGLRPLSPDGLPYIGRHSKYNNLIIAGGHAMIGISLAAATGKIVEELVSKKTTSLDIKAFNPERYA